MTHGGHLWVCLPWMIILTHIALQGLNEIIHIEFMVYVMYYLYGSHHCVPLVKKGSSEAITDIFILPYLEDSSEERLFGSNN